MPIRQKSRYPVYLAVTADHFARYLFALPHCGNRLTLDAGCKYGHGAQILSYGASEITLVDIENGYLRKASKFQYFCPIKIVQCDFEKDFPTGQWEAITCFEVIEHLENVEFFVKNIADHLVPGGKLIFSVPHMIANRLHKTLFDEEKIKNLIGKYLTIKEFYIQNRQIFSGRPLRGNLKCYLGVAIKQ